MTRLRYADFLAYASALALVIALGALNLNYPFVADHIVALAGARTLAGGGTLYVDFWDNKMPGLFWFYQLAGTLWGFDEFGIHVLDLIWMSVFAVVLMLALRDYAMRPWLSAIAPPAVVGVYYAAADAFHLTQVEILCALPLFLMAWLASRLDLSGWRLPAAFVLTGCLAGVVVTFKIVFAPFCCAIWLVAGLHAVLSRGMPVAQVVLRLWLPAAAGLLLVLAAVALRFHLDGALWELYWTAFVYPPAALESAPHASLLRLARSATFFASFYVVWGLFVVFAIVDWWRRERHIMTSMMLAWLVVGVGVILIQRFSWWAYHFLLLFTPVGVLGVRGIGVLPARLRARGAIDERMALLLTAALAFPAVTALAVPAEQKLEAHVFVFVRHKGDVRDLHRYISTDYRRIEHSVRFLANETARPGPIYVFGDPLYYHLSGRKPALPIIGWPWQYFLQSQWVHLPRQLEHTMPPYIYIDRDNDEIMRLREGGVRDFIMSAYVPLMSDHEGAWYQIRPDLWEARHALNEGD
jgi:hypothetical protein